MTKDRILNALEKLGLNKYRVSGDEENVEASCPFATWKHGSGRDERPSFYVKIEPGGASPYFCHACRMRGPDFRQIIWQIEALAGKEKFAEMLPDAAELRKMLMEMDSPSEIVARIGTYDGKDPADTPDLLKDLKAEEAEEADKRALTYMQETWEQAAQSVPKYLINKGVTTDTARTWQLRYDKEWMRVLFPIKDRASNLVGLAGRAVTPLASPKHLFWPGFRKSRFLYGSDKVDQSKDTLVVVEGFVDVLCLWQAGWNAVSIFGSYPSRQQVQQVLELTPKNGKLVVWMDGDKAGKLGLEEFKRKVNGRTPLWAVCIEGKDPKDLDPPGMAQAITTASLV